MTRNSNDSTFVKVTNKDVYDLLLKIKEQNASEHKDLSEHLLVTNGKVKKSLWMATTAITFAIVMLGFLFNHMGR